MDRSAGGSRCIRGSPPQAAHRRWAIPIPARLSLAGFGLLDKGIRRKIPFLLSNTVRVLLFATVLLLLFGIVGGRKRFVLYHFVNPFNLFGPDFDHAAIAVTVAVTLLLALLTCRPFCQFVCPFGLISWLVERLSLARVRIDTSRCNGCGACERACPSDAAKNNLAGKRFAADCYSCGRCLNVCPQDAITYGYDRTLAECSRAKRLHHARNQTTTS